MDEQELVFRLCEGDRLACQVFVQDYVPVMLAVARRFRDQLAPDQPEDVVQTILISLLEQQFAGLRQWDGRSSLRSYLAVFARNKCLDLLRANRARRQREQGGGPFDPPAHPAPGVVLLQEQASEALDACLNALGENDRRIIHGRLVLGERNVDLAEALGMSSGAVGVALHRGIKRLRDCLERRFPAIFRDLDPDDEI